MADVLTDLEKLESDAMALLPLIEQFEPLAVAIMADLEAVATDLGVDVPSLFNHPESRAALNALGDKVGNTRLQNLACMGIPIGNIFLAMYNLPTIPLPAFCTPTPTNAAMKPAG